VWQRRRRQATAEPDDRLFERLRVLRKAIADRDNLPPYIVFSDSTLKEMSEKRPVNKAAMLAVKGVSEAKYERYGEAFLREVLAYLASKQ